MQRALGLIFVWVLYAQVAYGAVVEIRTFGTELTTPNACNLSDITPDITSVQCFPGLGQYSTDRIQNGTQCLIGREVRANDVFDSNDVSLQQCVNGKWTETSLGERKSIQKRFLGFLAAVVIGCAVFCRGSSGSSGGNQPAPAVPPQFDDPCRPSDLLMEYNVEAGQTSTVVTWSDPVATNSDGTKSSVEQVQGDPSGSTFAGAPGAGRSHSITYKATDNNGLTDTCYFSFTVIIITCEPAVWPYNGHMSCSLNSYLGSVCTYSCNSGYEVAGSSQITCQGSIFPSWKYTPTCQKISCPQPPVPENGNVACTGSTYQSGCFVTCDPGYQLSGPSYIQCQADKTWMFAGLIKCTDNRPPSLSCIPSQTFYTDRGETSTLVEWDLPTATDALDPSPNITQTEGPTHGSVLPVGRYIIKYKATDSQGNESPECTSEIVVQETLCQHPFATLQDTNMRFSCVPTTYSYGTECSISCRYNIPLSGPDRVTCERNETSSNLAVGIWTGEGGIRPLCNLTECPTPDPPINGALAVDYIGPNKVLTMLCMASFDIPPVHTGFTGVFICTNMGVYNPSIDIPDCVVERRPQLVSLPSELFYYTGNCSDPATQELIKSNIEDIFRTTVNPILQTLCPDVNNCTTSGLRIICGPTSEGRIKRGAEENPHTINKREILPTLIVDFQITADLDQSLSFLDALTIVDNLLNDTVKPQFQKLVDNGTFDIDSFTLRNDSFQTQQYGSIECVAGGHILDGAKCLPCPPAYFLNATDNCELCPIGYYSDEAALTTCKACQTGYTTLKTGSKSDSQCIETCSPGKYSASGLTPCLPCAQGYYQDAFGMTSCIKCSTGTTDTLGSVSSNACQAFQLFVHGTGGPVTAVTISSNMADVSFVLWTKPEANGSTNANIILTSGGYDLIRINLTDVIRVEIPGTTINQAIGILSDSTWSHIAVTSNSTSGIILVYVDGTLQSSAITATSTPLVQGGAISLESQGNTGIFYTDVHLEDAVLSASDIATLARSCVNTRPSDVFNLDDLRDTSIQGVRIQTPSTCDAIDECDANPCNDHTCVNGINTYTCYCSGGWSGTNCTIPPNYCADHGCVNGATCVNGNNGYTCSCVIGFSGDLCEIAPVDGGYSEWSEMSPCSVSCGGGTKNRTRSCDSPPPSPYGKGCTGLAYEIQTCNTDTCPSCPYLERGFRAEVNCTEDASAGLRSCRIVCLEGYILPEEFRGMVYTCGTSTDHNWQPLNNAPDCVDPKAPTRIGANLTIAYNTSIDDSATSDVKEAISDNLSNVPCVMDALCTPSVNVINSHVSIVLITNIYETGDLGIQDYIENGTVSTSLQELVDAINSIEESVSYINDTTSIFDVTVKEVPYMSNQPTLVVSGNVRCPEGQTAINGFCAPCPEGTYATNDHCVFCGKGTYTSSTGQTSCTTCPPGLSTTTIGSHTASQCIVDVTASPTTSTTESTSTEGGVYTEERESSVDVTASPTTTTTESTSTEGGVYTEEKESSDNMGVFIGGAVGGVIVLVIIGIIWYKCRRLKKEPRIEIGSISKKYVPEEAPENVYTEIRDSAVGHSPPPRTATQGHVTYSNTPDSVDIEGIDGVKLGFDELSEREEVEMVRQKLRYNGFQTNV